MKIPLSSPDITDSEKLEVLKVLNTNSLSLGPKLEEFETNFSNFIGSKYVVAVNSGTSGLHLCVKAKKIEDRDVVITTSFSFIASSNCILFERARPIFVDIDEKTQNIDIYKLEEKIKNLRKSNTKIKAILLVHTFGRPCEMQEIMKIACKYEIDVIEDACEAIGAEYLYMKKWKKIGTFGDCAVFAFYPNKQITTGEGGIVITNNENIYKLCRSMRNQGREDLNAWLQHERLGFNYRLSDINCALGVAQLTRIDEILAKRATIAAAYYDRLKDFEGLNLPILENNKKISWFVYVVRLSDSFIRDDRDRILKRLKMKGIGCSNYFTPIHLQPFYKRLFNYKEGDFPITEKVSARTIALPFHNNLTEKEIDYVCTNLNKIIRKAE